MVNKNFDITIKVNVSTEEAMKRICHVKKWWATNIEGDTTNLNDVFTVRFGKTFSTIQITELIPDEKILWSILSSSLPLFKNEKVWNGTKILWEVSNTNNASEIRMTHIGLMPDKECYEDCNKGWKFYVGESLRKYITDDQGYAGTGIFANISSHNRRYEGLLYFKNDPLPDYSDNYFFVDVKVTKGETVTQIFHAARYDKKTFSPHQLKGDYFMIIENSALFGNLSPLEDILETKYFNK